MSSAARNKGHSYERWICAFLSGFGFESVTSRSESKRLDDKGSDLVTDFPFHIQAKANERLSMPVHELLSKMAKVLTDKPSCVWHKRNNKGTVVSLSLDDFMKLIEK